MSCQIMGILNVTPDSYHLESARTDIDHAVALGLKLIAEGADILDVGGEATSYGRFPEKDRKGGPVAIDEELRRVIPVIERLREKSTATISIDSLKAPVARAAVDAGANFINDQGGFKDPAMQELAMDTSCDLCIMHMQGTPATMQLDPQYPRGVVEEVMEFLETQANLLVSRGVSEDRIVIDPGLCFGKTVEHNYTLIREMAKFKLLGFRVLVGLSRKSLMTRVIDKPASELLSPTIGLNTLMIQAGVDILRVHDVAEHRKLVDLFHKAPACW